METTDAQGVPPPVRAAPGPAVAGEGRDVRLTLYPRRDNRAAVEVAVRRWTPVAGSANEFVLVDPEIRLRTNDDRAVRITAEKGRLEAQQKGGGSLDAQRGRLSGSVVIEIDRLTGDQRAQLPEDQRQKLDPSQVVRVTAPEMDFDLQYSKLTVPRGELHVSASDFDFRVNDLEVRFNEEAGRVEYLRINEGGRIELNGPTSELGLGAGTLGGASPQQTPLVDWMRNSLQSVLDPQTTQEPKEHESKPGTITLADDGTPVFHPQEQADATEESPVRYFSRFEGDVDVRQFEGKAQIASLKSDSLEIRRAITSKEKKKSRDSLTQRENGGPGADSTSEPQQRISLDWSGRLVIEACLENDDRCSSPSGFDVTATGTPARLSSPEGEAVCLNMLYAPDSQRLRLEGDRSHKVTVHSPEQGTLAGTAITSQQSGETMQIQVTGPGHLFRDGGNALAGNKSDGNDTTALSVDFSERLDAESRFVDRTWINLTQGLSKKRFQVLERATFLGDVALNVEDAVVNADELTVKFGSDWPAGTLKQTVDRVEGRGHVVMKQKEDHISCGAMDLVLNTDDAGRVVPATLTAREHVDAIQNDRSIQAEEELILDFATGALPVDSKEDAAPAGNVSSGPGNGSQRSRSEEIILNRLRGSGGVHVEDRQEGLDLRAQRLDCTLADGDKLDEVVVQGTPAQPATIELDTFSVTGSEILLYVADQRADVPTSGVMKFVSRRDLDGRKVNEPIPVSVSWKDWMTYEGSNNRAVLQGSVRASSNRSTTFECDRMEIQFEDSAPPIDTPETGSDWGILNRLWERVKPSRPSGAQRLAERGFSKEVTTILAKGNAVALTSEVDPDTGSMKSRARISGPTLSVNLKPEVSKMLIEGAGNLLLEDFRPARKQAATNQPNRGLFAIDEDSGPSKTLIRWDDVMSYDFSIDQTRFEGDVRLTYLSGAGLDRLFQTNAAPSGSSDTGRSTFLTCGILTVDFLERGAQSPRPGAQRMGRLSADRLRQFHASKAVELQDSSEGLALKADDLIFEKERDILLVEGSRAHSAHIVLAQPGQYPREYQAERFFYDLKSNRAQATRTKFRGR